MIATGPDYDWLLDPGMKDFIRISLETQHVASPLAAGARAIPEA